MTHLAMPELRQALVDAARARQLNDAPLTAAVEASRPVRPARRVLPRSHAALALVLLMLACAAGALASGLISFGSPAASVPVFANPRAGLGALTQRGVRMLPVSAPDPHGGPAWGMRELSTTRGVGCLQVGRIVDGRLAALGQDGAFGNDGLAHELPVSANIERLNCALLDARGRLFESVTIKSEAASAAPGVHCRPPGTYPQSRGPAPDACPLRDERNLYFGTLGPDATGLTYTIEGRTRTVATAGSDGAYLIVAAGTTHRYTGAAGASERAGLYSSDDVPVYSPITAISYRGGVTCHLLTAQRWLYGPAACSPALPEPLGYAPTPAPRAARLATPIRATLVRAPKRGWGVKLVFASKVSVSSLRGAYEVQWRYSGRQAGGEANQTLGEASSAAAAMIPQARDIAAGQSLSTSIYPSVLRPARSASQLAPGLVSGRVVLRYTDGTLIGAEEDAVRVPVGSFALSVP